ncbi:MAG: MATE family efflux transporter [Pseudomonadota bacterium]
MANDTDLTQGPVWRALLRVSAPMSLGILGVLMVGLADAFFLARYSEPALTAVGFIYPVIVTLTSLSIGLSAGTSAVVSNALGAGGDDGMQRLTGHVMLMGFAAASVVAFAFWLAGPWLFSFMGARGAVLEAVLAYIPWWCLSFPILAMSMSLNSVFRAAGQSGVAATVMVGQAALNVGFTPVLIFGFGPIPELGAEGAGMATFIARAIAGAAVVAYALHKGVLCRDTRIFAGLGASARKVARVAAPASLSNAINPGGMAAVTAAVAVAGDAAVGGFGAATRVQSLIFVPMLALSSGIGPVVGQAWGAGNQARAREAMRLTVLFCLGYGLLLVVLTWSASGLIAGWMTSTSAQAEAATQ